MVEGGTLLRIWRAAVRAQCDRPGSGHCAHGNRRDTFADRSTEVVLDGSGGSASDQCRIPDMALQSLKNMQTKNPAVTQIPTNAGMHRHAGFLLRKLCFRKCFDLKLQCTFNLLAAQATGANGHALRYAINQDTNLLRVRSPGAAGLAVGVADIIAVNYALTAYFTKLSHTLSHLLQGYVASKQ